VSSKPKRRGRPALPKAERKGYILPVRFNQEDRRRIENAAERSKQSVSDWVRSALVIALEGSEN
jgi:hypothetical protein